MRTIAMWTPASIPELSEFLANESLLAFENSVGCRMFTCKDFLTNATKWWAIELRRRYGDESNKPFPAPAPHQR